MYAPIPLRAGLASPSVLGEARRVHSIESVHTECLANGAYLHLVSVIQSNLVGCRLVLTVTSAGSLVTFCCSESLNDHTRIALHHERIRQTYVSVYHAHFDKTTCAAK